MVLIIAVLSLISKNEAINLMQNADLTKTNETSRSIKIYCHI